MVNAASIGLSTRDLYLFNKGNLFHSYRTLGAHPIRLGDEQGVRFAVWAPHAQSVRVVGSFNEWDGTHHAMERVGETGVWSKFVAGISTGTVYKYEIETKEGKRLLKSDPYAFQSERRPSTASVVAELYKYEWRDTEWQSRKQEGSPYHEPMLIYEVHAGSWENKGKEDFYTYEELADDLDSV